MPTDIDGNKIKDFVVSVFGGKNANSDPSVVGFYKEWSHYLSPLNALFTQVLSLIEVGIMKGLYRICAAMEQIFTLSFKVIGLTDTFQDKSSVAYTFFHGFQLVGIAAAGVLFMFYVIKNMTHAEFKYKKALTNIMYVTLFTSLLPYGVSQISTMTTNVVNAISNTDNSGMKVGSLSSQPIIDNTVDMTVIARHGFNYDLDKNGLIKQTDTSKKGTTPAKLNNLKSADDILHTDFNETLGPESKDMIKSLNKQVKGSGDIFTHQLYSDGVDKDGNTTLAVVKIKDHKIVKGFNVFEPLYKRYQINFFGVYAELIILSVMFLTMSIRLVKSGLDIVIMGIIAPYVGLRSISSKRKYKELLLSIEGAFASMIMNIVVLKIMYMFIQATPTLLGDTKVGSITKIIFTIVIYLGSFFGAFQGIGAIEKYTGVSQGHAESAQQIMGAAGLGMAAGGMAAGGVRAGGHVVQRSASSVKGLASKTATSIKNGDMAEKIGGVASTVAHPVQSAKAGLNNMSNNIKEALGSNSTKFQQGLSKYNSSDKSTESNTAENATGGGINNDSSDSSGSNNGQGSTDNSASTDNSGSNNNVGTGGTSSSAQDSNNNSPANENNSTNVASTNGEGANKGSSANSNEKSDNAGNNKQAGSGNENNNGVNNNDAGTGTKASEDSQNSGTTERPGESEGLGQSQSSDNPDKNVSTDQEPNSGTNENDAGNTADSESVNSANESDGLGVNNEKEDSNEQQPEQQPTDNQTEGHGLQPSGADADKHQESGAENNGLSVSNTQDQPGMNQEKGEDGENDHKRSKKDSQPKMSRSSSGTHFSPVASNRATQSMNQIIGASQQSHVKGAELDDDAD